MQIGEKQLNKKTEVVGKCKNENKYILCYLIAN